MMRRLGLALALLAALTTGAAAQRPPKQQTGPITIFGEGSSGPIGGMSARGRTLDQRFSDTINPADTIYAGGMKSDCTGVGVGSDSSPALAAAISAAIAANKAVVAPSGRFCALTPIEVNLQGKSGFLLDLSNAIITPGPGAMSLFNIHNGHSFILKARLIDGGPFRGWANAQPYPVNYTNVAEVVAGGGQEAFRISGVDGYEVDLWAQNYAGRLLRITNAGTGEPPTVGAKGRIVTTRGTDQSKPLVGQSIFTDTGITGYTGGWGHLEALHNNYDAYGPVWRDVNDVAVTYLDGAYAYTGVSLHGVGVVQGALWYVGDVFSNTNNIHVDFAPSPATGRLPYRLSLSQLTLLNQGTGLSIVYADPTQRAADIGILRVIGAGTAFGNALAIGNSKGINARVEVSGTGDSIASILGDLVEDVQLEVHGRALKNNFIYIGPEVKSRIQISGTLADPVAGRSVLVVGGDTPVRLSNLDVSGGVAGPSLLYFVSQTNKVRWVSGSKSGNATTYAGYPPSYVSPSVDIQ